MTRILVAEDSPTQAEKLRWILETEGFEVDVATSGEKGLERFAENPPDLVISDILMPGMTGYEFCHHIKKDRKGRPVPVILLSTLNDPMDIIRGLECEADNFITKPYEPEQLLARIRTVLANRQVRERDKLSFGVEIVFLGKKFVVNSAKEQILDLLIATFEDIVRTNGELKQSKAELATAQLKLENYTRDLERRVQEGAAELLDKQHMLHHAQKMEALGQLTGGLAHDFNNMLTIVIGNLDALSMNLEHDKKSATLAEDALEAACRSAELTRQLLAFSRKQQLEPAVSDLNEIADGMLKLLARTLGENIEIKFEPSRDLFPVLVDAAQLRSAIANLATNARDAMGGGGTLRVTTRNLLAGDPFLAAHPEIARADYAQIVVSDTGSGMSPETVARVFEPFFTTKSEGRGTGLGLSMVFGFIQQSGGFIKIESEIGKGTSIRILLPRARDAAKAFDAPADQEQTAKRSNDETILVVEDNAGVRRTVIQQLGRLGYHVIEADGVAAALSVLGNRADPIDLLFTDIVMPGGKDGRELVREARRMRPGLQVLLTSGYSNPPNGANTADSALPLLPKPYRIRDLAAKIRETLDNGKAARG